MALTINRSLSVRTALLAAGFVAGNLALPQIAHLVGGAGAVWLPIYFFTIIATCTCGLATGLVTAFMSAVLNHAIFGMPSAPMLPVILVKSAILCVAISATMRFARSGKLTLVTALLASLGTIAVSALLGAFAQTAIADSATAVTAVRVSLPGLLLQIALLTTLLQRRN